MQIHGVYHKKVKPSNIILSKSMDKFLISDFENSEIVNIYKDADNIKNSKVDAYDFFFTSPEIDQL